MQSTSISVKTENLTYKYNVGTAFEKTALDNVNITIESGEFIGVIGKTGSGKSTLIQHFNALLRPTSGRVIIDGEDIGTDKTKIQSARRKVGLVFQYPEYQLFELTVMKDVCFGPRNMGLSEDEARLKAKKALEIVNIPETIYEKSPFELSGGQKRRVAIAGVLAMEPSILILDEPTAGLDPRGRDEILENIRDMHKRLGITVILVSHSMEDISIYVERVMVMHNGGVILLGTPSEVFSQVSELERIGLAAPQISYLMIELRKKGFDVPIDVFTVPEATKVIYGILGYK